MRRSGRGPGALVGVPRNDGNSISIVRKDQCGAGHPDSEPYRSSQASSEYLAYFEAGAAVKAVATLNHTHTHQNSLSGYLVFMRYMLS